MQFAFLGDAWFCYLLREWPPTTSRNSCNRQAGKLSSGSLSSFLSRSKVAHDTIGVIGGDYPVRRSRWRLRYFLDLSHDGALLRKAL